MKRVTTLQTSHITQSAPWHFGSSHEIQRLFTQAPSKYIQATFATARPPRPSKLRVTRTRPSPRVDRARLPTSRISPRQGSPAGQGEQQPQQSQDAASKDRASQTALATALRDTDPQTNDLLAPVHIPEDASSVLKADHPSTNILANSSIVVTRQLELMNVIGLYDQANKYTIMDPQGNHLGHIIEKDTMGSSLARQFTSTHRAVTAHVFDKYNREVLRIHRPFSYINSRIGVYDPQEIAAGATSSSTAVQTEFKGDEAQVSPLNLSDMRIIGEAHQKWAPFRRKYDLFLARRGEDPEIEDAPRLTSGDLPISNSKALTVSNPSTNSSSTASFDQFAYVDEPFLSWDFSLKSSDHKLIGSVNRNFSGFGREIFTDTGVYALRMDAAGLSPAGESVSSSNLPTIYDDDEKKMGMTLDQRAVMLATAICVDFDYFSRKSGNNGIMPLWFPVWMGGGGGEAGAGEAAGGAVGEGGQAGVGGAVPDDASPTGGAGSSTWESGDLGPGEGGGIGEDVWGEQNPWGQQGGGGDGGGGGGGGGGDGGGGGGFDIGDWL